MEWNLAIGGMAFLIVTERPVPAGDGYERFQSVQQSAPDVTITFHWGWDGHGVSPQGTFLGQDTLLEHYLYDGCRCAFCRAGDGYQSIAVCTPDFSRVDVRLDTSVIMPERANLATLMRFVPMAAILSHFNAFVLHASQIKWKGKGIVFSAPSGTGKTTQAKLWSRERGARLLCNDRTLFFRRENGWHTSGYLLDGSEPVYSRQETEPGCIVILRQGKKNEVRRIPAGKAMAGILSQAMVNGWESGSGMHFIDLLTNLLEQIPVYQYACTPDAEAVDVLEEYLMKEGVISDGVDTNDT